MPKSRRKNSSSSGVRDKTDTKSEEIKLDKDEEKEEEVGKTGVASDKVENYVCDKCFSIWSDEVLDILFRGTDTVTVNSKITYGAVVRFFEWAKAHLGKYANEAVATLLFRADIGDNLKFLQMEDFDDELGLLLREGEIVCCSVFLLIYQPHEMVSKIMPENTHRISLRHHIYLFGCKQSTESSPSPDSCESPCKETSSAEISPSRKEVMGSDDSESEGVDMGDAPLPDASESAYVTDDQESMSVTDAPESTSITDTPESTSVADAPESTSVADAPESTSVADAPQSTPAIDFPEITPVADAPKSAPVKDTVVPASAPVVDVQEGTPVSDVLKSTSVTEVPESASVTEAPESASVTEVPESASVTEVPESASVTEVPESASVADVSGSAPVADVSGSAPVTGNLQASPVQSSRVENKQASPILSPKVKNKLGESTESKDNKVKDSDEGGNLKRDSSSLESKDKNVKDSTGGQERKKSISPQKKVIKPPSPSPLGKEGKNTESSRSDTDAKSGVSSNTRSNTKSVGNESVMSNDTREEPSSWSTCDKEGMLESSSKHVINKSRDKSSSSIKENESTEHKDGQEIKTSGNVEGNETPEGKGNRPQTKTVEKVEQIDKKELQSPAAKRKTRSMSNVDSDGSSSREDSQRVKRRKVESSSNKELTSGIVPLQLPAKREVRDDKMIKDAENNEKLKSRKSTAKVAQSVIKDAENSEKLKARKSTAEVAQSLKEDIVLNNGNVEKVNQFKKSETLSAVCVANEKAESHSTYEKPYVTRAGDRMQRRRRSGNLQDCTDGERKNSLLKERVETSEKNEDKIEIIERKRKRDEKDVKDCPDEETLTAKRKRFRNLHTPEKNIIQTRRKSTGSTEPVVSKKIVALLTETEDSDSACEFSAETDGELSEVVKVSFKEPAGKKIEMKQKVNKLMYTKALESIKEFDVNFMHKLSFKDIGELVVNVSTIDFSQFDGPQSTRRGVTKEWLENPVPKTVAVSNGMILELFEYLFERMTVIKVLSVMFWLLKKLDSKLQASNSMQVKDAVALVIKEFEAMDEDMFVVYKLMPFKPTNVRYVTQTSLDMKDSKRIPYLTFANGEMLFLHNHLVLNPTNPDPLRFYNLIRNIMDLRNTVLLVPDSQTLVQIGESVRKEFYAQRLAGTEQEFVCKEWDCKKLFRTGKPAIFQTKVRVRDILAHFMKWKNAAKENGGVVNSAMELNHSIESLFDKTIELRGIVMSSRFDKVGFCFQLYAKYCDIVFLQKNLKNGLEFLESYTGLDEILFFQSRRKLKSQCDIEHSCPGKCEDVSNEEKNNVSQLESQISTLSNELDVLTDTNKHTENKIKELVKNISSLKKGVNAEQSQLISQIAEISVTLQGKKEGSEMSVSKDSKRRVKKVGALSSVCSAIKDLVANDVPVGEIRRIIEVIMENIVGKEPCSVPNDDWIHKYVKELDTSCEVD